MTKKNGKKPGTFVAGDARINRAGRPKRGKSFTDILRAVGEEGRTMEEVARRVWGMAKGGSMAAVSFLADRLDGKVADRLAMEAEPLPGAIDFDALGAFIMGEEIPPAKIPAMERHAAALTPMARKLTGREG